MSIPGGIIEAETLWRINVVGERKRRFPEIDKYHKLSHVSFDS